MQFVEVTVMWRRIDQPGHEVMRFTADASGRRIEGFAAYREAEGPIGLRYGVEIAEDWTTRRAVIEGHALGRPFEHHIERNEAGWLLDGVSQHGLEDIPHLDFGFTPATNMPQLRHAGLRDGQTATFGVAWFDIGKPKLERLSQTYRRVADGRFAYDSPASGYSAELQLAEDGFTIVYPDLWERLEN
jgi:uncharacterized protein